MKHKKCTNYNCNKYAIARYRDELGTTYLCEIHFDGIKKRILKKIENKENFSLDIVMEGVI
mgnify:CR=1 FL=1